MSVRICFSALLAVLMAGDPARGEMFDLFASDTETGSRQNREYRGRVRVHEFSLTDLQEDREAAGLDFDRLPDYRAADQGGLEVDAPPVLSDSVMQKPGRVVSPAVRDDGEEDPESGWGWLAKEVLSARKDQEETDRDETTGLTDEEMEELLFDEPSPGEGEHAEVASRIRSSESPFGIDSTLRRNDGLFLSVEIDRSAAGNDPAVDSPEGETTSGEFESAAPEVGSVRGLPSDPASPYGAAAETYQESRYLEDRLEALNWGEREDFSSGGASRLEDLGDDPGGGSLFEYNALGGASGSGPFGPGYEPGGLSAWGGGVDGSTDPGRSMYDGGSRIGSSAVGAGLGSSWRSSPDNAYGGSSLDRGAGASSSLLNRDINAGAGGAYGSRFSTGVGTEIRGLGDEPAGRSSALPW